MRHRLRPCEEAALNGVADRAAAAGARDRAVILELLSNLPETADPSLLIDRLLTRRAATLNFHPDRLTGDGTLILEGLLAQGRYQNQFVTGTTNGGKTAYPGGDRDLWERELFQGAYHQSDIPLERRPKYGALNLHNYLDGASARFGSCFFVIKSHVLDRCTFAFGDSHTHPDALGSRVHFLAVLRALFEDVAARKHLLDRPGYDVLKAVRTILAMREEAPQALGRSLDDCIEVHVHGEIDLGEDIASFYVDESFRNTKIHELTRALCGQYGVPLRWIPVRQIHTSQVGDAFRGPAIPPLARRIAEELGDGSGLIHAELLGKASRSITRNPEHWADLGDEPWLFQYIKQLWHTVAVFG